MICAQHNKEFKGPNKRGNYWHVIDFDKDEYCNMPANQTAQEYTPKMEEKAQEIRQELNTPAVEQKTKELTEIANVIKSESMLVCNAMNNACVLLSAGTIKADQLEATFERILRILESKR